MNLEISVIIPTLGERATLDAALAALEKQFPSRGSLEVLVVDNSPQQRLFSGEKAGFPGFVRVLGCKKPGAAAARNFGSRETEGEFLLFMDDDVVSLPGLIAEHLKCVKSGKSRLSMGKMLPAESVKSSLFGEFAVFYGLLPDYKNILEGAELSCEHFNSSSFMIRKEDFRLAGGFEEGFDCYGWEDVEFGSRLPEKGLRVFFNSAALAEHRVESNLLAYLRKMKLMGRSAVKLAGLHPELAKRINILNYDADRGLFRYNIKEIEKLDLGESEALKAAREFAASIEKTGGALLPLYNYGAAKEMLFECYALLLRHEYLAGLKDALLALPGKERKAVVDSLENSEVSKQSSLREELEAYRKVLKHRDRHPLRFLLANIRGKLTRRKE